MHNCAWSKSTIGLNTGMCHICDKCALVVHNCGFRPNVDLDHAQLCMAKSTIAKKS